MKSILFGSIVAAALIFSGCGSSSKHKDSNTTAEGNGNQNQGNQGNGGNGNQNQGGGDNNQSQGGGDNNQSQSNGDTFSINGLTWTKIQGDATKAPVSYSEANSTCSASGARIPTLEELQALSYDNIVNLGNGIYTDDDNNSVNFHGAIWSSTNDEGDDAYRKVLIVGEDGAISDTAININDAENNYYFTCVKN